MCRSAVFKNFVCCVSLVVLASCAGNDQPKPAANAHAGTEVTEPVLGLTPKQKEQGGYSFEIKGPVLSESFSYTASEGSRAFYNKESQTTRMLARDEDNSKNTLMIDLKGNRAGKFLINASTAGEVAVVIGVVNSDGSPHIAGILSTNDGGEVYISEREEGGYIAGTFKGVIKVEKKPHEVTGKFRVRMKAR